MPVIGSCVCSTSSVLALVPEELGTMVPGDGGPDGKAADTGLGQAADCWGVPTALAHLREERGQFIFPSSVNRKVDSDFLGSIIAVKKKKKVAFTMLELSFALTC